MSCSCHFDIIRSVTLFLSGMLLDNLPWQWRRVRPITDIVLVQLLLILSGRKLPLPSCSN